MENTQWKGKGAANSLILFAESLAFWPPVEVIILLRFPVTRTIGKLFSFSALLKVSLWGQFHHPCRDYLVHPGLPTEQLTAPAIAFPEKKKN